MNKMVNGEENIFAEERKHLIVELVNKQIKTTVTQLCEQFNVSPATIRNDLRELEFAGLLKRTHGGAICNKKANYEPNSYQKLVEQIDQKRAIAKAAARYVEQGDTIAIDTGTNTYEFVKEITSVQNLTVVTNDVEIASYLERNSDANVILTGGMMRRDFHCTVGPIALNSLENLNVDRAFISCNGINVKKGVTTPNIDIANIKKALINLGDEVILLADFSKIGKSSFAKFADLDKIDVLITDSGANEEIIAELGEAGVNVEVCDMSAAKGK